MLRIGVTGTDTGVGKTVIASAILAHLHARGMRVAGMKPVETGVTPDDPGRDAALLARAAGGNLPLAEVGPILLEPALAPMVAAQQSGVEIDFTVLDGAFESLSAGRDAIVVEGAGGLLSPLARDVAFDRLCERWGLDLVIVAGNRLGALNHTLLTFEVAEAAGLQIAGVVVNSLDPREAGLVERTNRTVLREVLKTVPIVEFPWVDEASDPAALADAAEASGLSELFERTGKT